MHDVNNDGYDDVVVTGFRPGSSTGGQPIDTSLIWILYRGADGTVEYYSRVTKPQLGLSPGHRLQLQGTMMGTRVYVTGPASSNYKWYTLNSFSMVRIVGTMTLSSMDDGTGTGADGSCVNRIDGIETYQTTFDTIAGGNWMGNALAVGDFDADDQADVVLASDGHIVVMKQLEGRSFATARETLFDTTHERYAGMGAAVAVREDGSLLVGAPGATVGGSAVGALFVLDLDAVGSTTSNVTIDVSAHIALSAGAEFGSAVALLGDVDGDGVRDVAVAAPGQGTNGAVYILLMNADGVSIYGV
jgi:hypothetical protein